MKADKTDITRLIKTARGQLDGILRMIDEDRYCIDISNQLLATEAIIKKANKAILSAHMKCCVTEAVESGDPDEKFDELISIIDKL
ncbi:MAG: metal-sensing transcriptional repressor [Oscillospiraceae bacterium]